MFRKIFGAESNLPPEAMGIDTSNNREASPESKLADGSPLYHIFLTESPDGVVNKADGLSAQRHMAELLRDFPTLGEELNGMDKDAAFAHIGSLDSGQDAAE